MSIVRRYSFSHLDNRFDAKKSDQAMTLEEVREILVYEVVVFPITANLDSGQRSCRCHMFPQARFCTSISSMRSITSSNLEFLTRREELLHLARRVLQNIGVSNTTHQKRYCGIELN